ncbi:dimethylaniline monooxygenase [N-oxide-forming] 5-like protein, partial [Leptotrombidium deliense]
INNNEVKLFKNVFQPDLKHPQTLAIIGLIQPSGSLIPVSEMQSRWFAQLMKGDKKLPTKQKMLSEIEEDIKAINDRYYASKRHTIQIEYIPYMDKLASYVGCKPNLFRIAITDVKLWFQLIFGPIMSYQYRLTGPNHWAGARDALLTYKQRFIAPFKC